MGAQRAAWEAAFAAELASAQCKDHVQILLDLVKAFETIPHCKLVEAAIAKGYSLAVLRLSLAAYRLMRSVGIDGVYSKCVRATRGITAGSGFATSELRLLLLDVMIELQARWSPTLACKLYVDDLTLSASGRPGWLVRMMTRVMAFVAERLEGRLELEISAKKSVAVASRTKLAIATVQAMASQKVKPARRGKLLGIDATGGRRRSTHSARVRLHHFTKMIPRIHALKRTGANAKQMVRAMGPPAILYGCEIARLSDTALQTARSRIARAAAPEAGGKNPDATLCARWGLRRT